MLTAAARGTIGRGATMPESEDTAAPPRRQERLLIDLVPELRGERILCTSAGYGQLALAFARARPAARVHCHYFDLYLAEEARRRATASGAPVPANLTIACAADPPADEVDLAALPLSATGEADLARELLQAAHERLALGGLLAASTDKREDRWLHEQMRRLFPAATRRASPFGTVYIARKTVPLKKRIDFAATFAFRDRGRLIRAVSRPGVFSHRKLDPGARALLEAMEVAPGERVLDIGCGTGVLSFAAALRVEGVAVRAVDSNARAVACTEAGARLNGLAGVDAALDASGGCDRPGAYDLVLANPPYYSHYTIARLFLEGARKALRPGGRLLLVTKSPEWYREHAPALFARVDVRPSRGYEIVEARV
jgi:16S rRNA (guanine1207-N2)-methyltransferase